MTPRPRFNAGPAVGHPREPLRDAFIVWDTRTWNGMADGVSVIANQGSAGSAWDLVVSENASGTIAEVSQAGDWALLGGPPCDGPFTVMVVGIDRFRFGGFNLGPTFNQQEARIGWPSVAYPTVPDVDLGGSFPASQNGAARIDMDAGGGISAPIEFWAGIGTAGPPAFYTMTYDPVDSGSTVWNNLTAFSTSVVRSGGVGACLAVPDVEAGSMMGYIFGPIPRVQLPDQGFGVTGMVVFRGEPSDADMAYWQTYFQTPIGNDPFLYEFTFPSYSGRNVVPATTHRAWYDGTYCYHFLTAFQTLSINKSFFEAVMSPKPSVTLPSTIDFLLVGAGDRSRGGGTTTPGGGGGGGEVIAVTGHTAPVAPTSFEKGVGSGSNFNGRASFEGYTAEGATPSVTFLTSPTGGNSLGGVYVGGSGVGGTGGAGGGGGGALTDGTNGTTGPSVGGDGGDGYASDWHWTGDTYYHGGGGRGGSASTPGSQSEPRALGYGGRGAISAGQLEQGGPAGLIVRYAY